MIGSPVKSRVRQRPHKSAIEFDDRKRPRWTDSRLSPTLPPRELLFANGICGMERPDFLLFFSRRLARKIGGVGLCDVADFGADHIGGKPGGD